MNKSLKTTALILALAVFALGGCEDKSGQKDAKAGKGRIELSYVEWSTEVASTNVVRVVLEQMGYEVKTIPVSAAAMWQAVATGDADGMVGAWLPTTHAHYQDAVKGKVENLGPNLEGTKIGLVVPAHVPVDEIAGLNEHRDKLGGRIVGIDPGAGLMSKTEKAIEDYGLDLKLVEGSDATMIATLADAVKKEEWIVVTGWTPHWIFIQYDLKYLEDPKNVYGGEGTINTVVRTGLEEDMPDAYALLDAFHWTIKDVEGLMMKNRDKSSDPYENAGKWVEQNKEKVDEWLAAVEKTGGETK